MYKDKDKQREANRQASQRRRDKGMTQGMTNEGMTAVNEQAHVIPKHSYIGAVPEVPGVTVLGPKRGKDIKCFADLPPDVQQTIEKMSSNDGGITWDKEKKANRTAIAINYQHLFPGGYHSTSGETVGVAGLVIGKPGDADYNGVCTEAWRVERGR